MNIKLKRAYDPPSKEDGFRILVDRLWPRSIKKEDLKIDFWIKEIAPSNELRKWFAHDKGKWKEFQKRYDEELKEKKHAVEEIGKEIQNKGTVTLVYGSKEPLYNNAVFLKKYLEKQGKKNVS